MIHHDHRPFSHQRGSKHSPAHTRQHFAQNFILYITNFLPNQKMWLLVTKAFSDRHRTNNRLLSIGRNANGKVTHINQMGCVWAPHGAWALILSIYLFIQQTLMKPFWFLSSRITQKKTSSPAGSTLHHHELNDSSCFICLHKLELTPNESSCSVSEKTPICSAARVPTSYRVCEQPLLNATPAGKQISDTFTDAAARQSRPS